VVVRGALAARAAGSSAVLEWVLAWPGIGIALDSCSRVIWPLLLLLLRADGSSLAVGIDGGVTDDCAGGTDGSGTDGVAGTGRMSPACAAGGMRSPHAARARTASAQALHTFLIDIERLQWSARRARRGR
jgi:hypothetical protein